MIIMGIDPGTASTGWGVIDATKQPTYVASGMITTSAALKHEERLAIIYKDTRTLLAKYKPDALCVELLFFNTNAKTAMLVGQARGVVLLAAQQKKIPVVSYTPLQVKMALTGYGRADKKQMQEMVKTTLTLASLPKPDDMADALAIALAHAFSRKMREVRLNPYE